MAQGQRRAHPRRLSLSVRLSLLVLFAALAPLAIVVAINTYTAGGKLVSQARTALSTDGTSKVAQLDLYMHERTLDGFALATLPTAQAYVACTVLPQPPAALPCDDIDMGLYKASSLRGLAVGTLRDVHYVVLSLFSARGDMLLTCVATHDTKTPCAQPVPYNVPKQYIGAVQGGKQVISAVYYDPQAKVAYVHIYTPIALEQDSQHHVLGFLDGRVNLDYMWGVVGSEKDANGSGSYAFITDENGVRIADTKPDGLFHAVMPLNAATLQQIAAERRFGSDTPVPQDDLPALATSLKSTASEDAFQAPAVPGSTVEYQYVRERMTTVPWTYFVLSPLSTVTQVADAQVQTSLISAGVVAVLAILIGLLIGRGTTRPVSEASAELAGAAVSLKKLAARQENSAGEQQWVIDACRTGLESVRYLSDAMNQAARRIIEASNWFGDYWDRLTEDQARRTVQHLLELARYVDEAARRQQASSDRLGKAITVTTQVSDQLVAGANAATTSAEQLEQVVTNLQRVVGGRIPVMAELGDEFEMEQLEPMMPAHMPMDAGPRVPASPFGPGRPGRLDLPPPNAQRQLMAPGGGWGGQSMQGAQGWGAAGGGAPGQSQVFSGGYGGEYDAGYGGDGGYGGYGGYGGDYTQQQDPWANAGQGRQGWNGR
jgi:hypothetical protein